MGKDEREIFHTHLLPRKEEMLGIKEKCPMEYMPYVEDQFCVATGLRLKGLRDFTGWIKPACYYHGLVARQGHLHRCLHLMGMPLPRWPQVTPSESCLVSQKKMETQATSSSVPSAGAMETQGAHSNDTPAPMETGRVGDGQSWAKQVEASVDEEYQKDRPAKHRQSQSRRREERPTLPFPLQDNKGRYKSTQQLYQHAGEQPQAHHNVATQGIIHLHLEVLPRETRSLGNQVLCMIAEYHLTGSAQGSSSLSPVLPEAVTTLLPPVEDYVAGGTFQGMRDVRVVDKAKTLRIAAWLHHLDMLVVGDGMASQTLEVTWYSWGPLLELFLAPMMGSLTFKEVIDYVLNENWCGAESSLDDLWGHCAQILGELDDLIRAHGEESNKSSQKRIKKEIDLRRKDLESLRMAISHHESNLGQDQPEDIVPSDDGLSDHGVEEATEAEMATALEADDTPSGSAATQFSDPPPAEGQACAMEVDDEDSGPSPASPVSPADDDLLTGGGAVGVEADLAHLMVSSPRGSNGSSEDASI